VENEVEQRASQTGEGRIGRRGKRSRFSSADNWSRHRIVGGKNAYSLGERKQEVLAEEKRSNFFNELGRRGSDRPPIAPRAKRAWVKGREIGAEEQNLKPRRHSSLSVSPFLRLPRS